MQNEFLKKIFTGWVKIMWGSRLTTSGKSDKRPELKLLSLNSLNLLHIV